jgi:hypothetical protein
MRSGQRIRALAVVVAAGLWGAAGCGPGGPKTYPVRGKVELAGGNVADLAGASVEAALDSDPTVRASGVIAEDGSFQLETLNAGVILRGAQEGTYKARILPGDEEDRQARTRQRAALNAKYTQFQTSDLSFKVPTEGNVVLKLVPR